jgi:hypothetical protein
MSTWKTLWTPPGHEWFFNISLLLQSTLEIFPIICRLVSFLEHSLAEGHTSVLSISKPIWEFCYFFHPKWVSLESRNKVPIFFFLFVSPTLPFSYLEIFIYSLGIKIIALILCFTVLSNLFTFYIVGFCFAFESQKPRFCLLFLQHAISLRQC